MNDGGEPSDNWTLSGGGGGGGGGGDDDNDQLQQPSNMSGSLVGLVAVYGLLVAVGALGNGWVACVLGRLLVSQRCRYRRVDGGGGGGGGGLQPERARHHVQLYILALCVCDLLVLAFVPFLLCDLVGGGWPSSLFWCRLYLASEALNKFAVPFLLMAHSGYCYFAITNVGAFQAGVGTRTTCLVIAGCLLLVVVLATPIYLFGTVSTYAMHSEDDEHVVQIFTKCAFHPPTDVLTAFVVYGFLLGYLLPAGAFTFFYLATVNRVRLLAVGGMRTASSHFSRVAKTSVTLVAFYLVCWSPYWFLNIWKYLVFMSDQRSRSYSSNAVVTLSYVVHLLPYVSCTGFPILYTLSNKKIKEAYRRLTLVRSQQPSTRRPLTDAAAADGHTDMRFFSKRFYTAG